MQAHDIALGEQVIQAHELDARGRGLGMLVAGITQHTGAESPEELARRRADVTRAYDAHGLAGNLRPHETRGGLPGTRRGIARHHLAEHVDCKAHGELGHRRIGIARAVADHGATLLAFGQVNVVDTREGHRDHLGPLSREGRRWIGIVSDHDHVGALRAMRQFGWVGRLVRVGDELVTRGADARSKLLDPLSRDPQGLKQGNLHAVLLVLFRTTCDTASAGGDAAQRRLAQFHGQRRAHAPHRVHRLVEGRRGGHTRERHPGRDQRICRR